MSRLSHRTGKVNALLATAAFAAIAAVSPRADAATVTWNNATPPGNWSAAANWTGGAGVPVAADTAVFGATGSSGTQGTVTNVVDTDFTIAALQYN